MFSILNVERCFFLILRDATKYDPHLLAGQALHNPAFLEDGQVQMLAWRFSETVLVSPCQVGAFRRRNRLKLRWVAVGDKVSRRHQQRSTVGCWVVPVLASGEGCYPVAQHRNWSSVAHCCFWQLELHGCACPHRWWSRTWDHLRLSPHACARSSLRKCIYSSSCRHIDFFVNGELLKS